MRTLHASASYEKCFKRIIAFTQKAARVNCRRHADTRYNTNIMRTSNPPFLNPDMPSATSNVVVMSMDILDRMERAVAKVRERLLRATAALNQIGVGLIDASWLAKFVAELAERLKRLLDTPDG
jgi:hypothetical protein